MAKPYFSRELVRDTANIRHEIIQTELFNLDKRTLLVICISHGDKQHQTLTALTFLTHS